jgi:phage replication O-like protein O
MPGPQLEEGHIRIANELWEALCRIRIPGEARQVLDAIIRQTYGWGKKQDTISLLQLSQATGLPKPKIIRARKKLQDMNMISVAQKGNDIAPTYSINKYYNKWKSLPKKGTLPKKGIVVAQKGNNSLPLWGPSKDTIKNIENKNILSPENLFDLWNEHATNGIPKAKKLTKSRIDKIKSRIKEESGKSYWITVFSKIHKLPFYCGENNRGWVADFDYVMKNDTNHVKIFEKVPPKPRNDNNNPDEIVL